MAPKKNQGKFVKKKTAPVRSSEDNTPASGTKKGSGKAVVIFVVLCLLISAVASVFFLDKLGVNITLPGRTISAGVTVAGVDVGGLKRSEAEEAVTAAIGNSYRTNSMVIAVRDKELEITPAESGAVLDVAGAVKEAFHYGTQDNPELHVDIIPYLALNTGVIRQQIAEVAKDFPTEGIPTGSQIIKKTVDGEEQEVLEVTVGTVYYTFSEDDLYEAIIKAYNDHKFTANYSFDQIDAASIDLDALYAEHCTEAVDAVLDPETHEVTQSSNGYRFDLDSAREALAAANPGDVLTFPFEDVLPEMDTETLKSMLFRDQLATCTASQSSSANRATNLRLACEALNGIILYPGDTFSYNETLGERTAAKGYKPAGSYVNGETVDTYGGGICQPSSALYNCTLIADLEIVQRRPHAYPSSYVPLGMDATVDWNGPDFQFKNNTAFPIRIDAKANGGSVTITLVGTETKDYYVKMEYEVLSTTYPKTVEIETTDKSQDGKVKTTAYTGYTVQTYKLKYDKETDQLISREKEAYSAYSKRDKEVYKYISNEPEEEATKPTEPKPTEPKPTEPKPTEPAPTEPEPTEPAPTEPKPTEPAPTEPPVGEAGSDVQIPGE